MARKTLAKDKTRDKRVKEYARAIGVCVKQARHGYIAGSHEESILLELGVELGLAHTYSSKPVPRTGYQKLLPGDRQAMARDALELAKELRLVELRYDEERGEFQLYPARRKPRWTFVDKAGAHNPDYLPRRQQEFAPWHDTPVVSARQIRVSYARTAQLAMRWNA